PTSITAPTVSNTVFGQKLTIQATVSSPGGIPTGWVEFIFTGPHAIAPRVAQLVNGVATLTLKDVPAGAGYTVRAQYLDSAHFLGNRLSTATTFNITKDTSHVTRVKALVAFQQATLIARVATTNGGPATGEVVFTVKGPNGETHTYSARLVHGE